MVARMYDALHHPHTQAQLTCTTDTGSAGYTHRFFKASHNVDEMVSARAAIAADGVKLYRIPGHHMNVLRPPQMQVLAEKLLARLTPSDEVVSLNQLSQLN